MDTKDGRRPLKAPEIKNRLAHLAQTDCRHFSGYKPCGRNDLCSPQCPFKEEVRPRILIIHLDAMGAVLRATAILRGLKRKWPESHITWITQPRNAPLLDNNPYIDRILKNDHDGALALSVLQFDYTFCLDKSLAAAGLLRLPMSAGEVKGFGVDPQTGSIIPLNPEAARLYELGLSNREKFFGNKSPEVELLAEAMGLDYLKDEYVFRFTAAESCFRDQEKRRLGLADLVGPVIGLNTGCGGMIPYKQFSIPGWLELIKELGQKFPQARFLLLGGPEDTARNQELKRMSTVPLIETPTAAGLRLGFIYMDLCDVVVSGDSLGMHMAIALKKWVVAWFGPTCAHEIEFYGRGYAVKSDAICSPCWRRSCDKPKMCYDQVQWSKVIQGVKLGLSRRNRPAAPENFLAGHAKKISEASP